MDKAILKNRKIINRLILKPKNFHSIKEKMFIKIHDFFENVLFALKPLGIMIFSVLFLLLLMALIFMAGFALTGTVLKIIHGV